MILSSIYTLLAAMSHRAGRHREAAFYILKGLCCDVPLDFLMFQNLIFHAPEVLSIIGLVNDVLNYNDGLLEFRDVGQEGLATSVIC